MGLTNKLATKVRTRDRTELTNLPDPWDEVGARMADAAVRAAVVTIGGLRLNSSAFRGSDFLGINSGRSNARSIVWFEREDSRTWNVALGQQTVKGIAYDWKATFKIVDGPQGRECNISTPAVATKDGTLMNKDAYGEVRDLILEGFRLGRAPSASAEAAASGAGLAVHAKSPLQREIRAMAITTAASAEAIRASLERLPFPQTHTVDGLVWSLGTPSVDATGACAEAAIRDERTQRVVTIQPRNLPTEGFAGLLTRSQIDAINNLTINLIRKDDPAATIAGIDETSTP